MTGLKVVLVVIFSNIIGLHAFSDFLSQFGESVGEQILVNVKPSTRSKRSTDGGLLPDRFDLSFAASGSQVKLALHRNDKLNLNVPTFGLKDGRLNYEKPNISQNGVFYQETTHGGSFLVYFNKDRRETMYGIFNTNGSEFILQSNETKSETKDSNEFRSFEIKKAKQLVINDDVIQGYNVQDEKKSKLSLVKKIMANRQKRASGTYGVELLIVVDYSIYQRWFQKSTGTTTSARQANAVTSIRQFYAFIINGIDAMYKNIQTVSFQIDILFSGIIISQSVFDAPWTENIRIQSVTPNQVDAATALSNFNSWFKTQTNIPEHDHAMLFTGYNMIKDGSDAITGFAYQGAICTATSQSIVEDAFNFVMITVAAHELGHSLNAGHDGIGNICRATDAYIMTATSTPQATSNNPWKFSTCSTSSFANKLDSLTSPGQNCMTSQSSAYDPNALRSERQRLPGQLYTADQQCANIVGTGSYMCRQRYNGDFSSICNILWCSELSNPSICRTYVAGDGTQCGNRKWCVTGTCTYSASAPAGSDTCLYGDQKGAVFSNGWTCADMIQNGPHNCQTPSVGTTCCVSCGPSTQAPATTTTTTPRVITTSTGTITRVTQGPTVEQTTIVDRLEEDYVYIIIGLGAAGIVIVVIVVALLCCCDCCQRKPKTVKSKAPARSSKQLSYITHTQPRQAGYVNQGMVYDNVINQNRVQKVQRQYRY